MADISHRTQYRTVYGGTWYFGDVGSEAECRKSANSLWQRRGVVEVRIIRFTPEVLAHRVKDQ